MSTPFAWRKPLTQVAALSIVAVALLLTLIFVQPGEKGKASATPVPPLPPSESNLLADMREAGIHGDRSQVPSMIQALKSPHPTYVVTALHALAQLGATEAIPTVDQIMQRSAGDQSLPEYTLTYAHVARARLLAEAEGQKANVANAQAQTKVSRFLAELNLTPSQIVTGASAYHQFHESHQGLPVEVDAMQELGDMVYHGDSAIYQAYLHDIDFTQDEGAVLKVNIAKQPSKNRLAYMIDQLAVKHNRDLQANLLLQLAVDEGLPASQMAASKLNEMASNRQQYSEIGFLMLFLVIEGVGDQKQAPVVAQFLHDQDSWVISDAQNALSEIKQGRRVQFAAGY